MRLFRDAFIVRLVMAQVRKIADQVPCVLFEIRLQLLISLGRHRRGVRAGPKHGGAHLGEGALATVGDRGNRSFEQLAWALAHERQSERPGQSRREAPTYTVE